MKQSYTFCKSGKMDTYGLKTVKIVRENQKDMSGTVLLVGILLALAMVGLAYLAYTSGITVTL